MIVVDASALAAILFREPDADLFTARLTAEPAAVIAAPTLLELRLALLGRVGPELLQEADLLIRGHAIRIVDFGPEHLAIATEAATRFRGRPARLNFGDCMSYAVAKMLDAPLLFKGDDFTRTDIRSALD